MKPGRFFIRSSLLLLGLSVWGMSALLRAQVPGTPTDDRTYDFGLIPLGTIVHHTFTLKNDGKKALVVGKVSTSCGCTQVVSFPHQIPPGGHGDFVAVMDHQHLGFTDVNIYVPTGPAAQDLYSFRLVGILVDKAPPASVNPSLISAKEALAKVMAPQPAVVIDVRPRERFAAVHARGSQNMMAFALETRQDLKSQSVIVIDGGFSDPALLARMDHFKKLGFQDVRLLEGGLRAWQLAGGGLEESAVSGRATLAQVSFYDFYREQRSPADWLVINTDHVPGDIPTSCAVKKLPLESNPQAFVKNLAEFVGKSDGPKRVLITSSLGNGYDQIEAALRTVKWTTPIYYLEGGTLGYIAYSRTQTMSLNPQKITMDTSKASVASNQIKGQIVHGGGCSGCGH